MDETITLLQDLVAIRSTNPMGRDVSGPDYTEAAMADYVEAYLKKFCPDVVRTEVKPGRPNVIAHLEAAPDAPTLIYEAHMDTVLVEGMTIDPFDPVIKDGKMFGRGSCDTKASLASMMVALKRLAEAPDHPRINLVLVAVMDEEFQFTGIKHALANGLKADFGICGEPTELDLVIAHKGIVRWKIHTCGVSTHSARCDEGVNAIYRMAKIVSCLERFHREELSSRPQNKLLGVPTLSVGRIIGGQTVNTVPDWAHIEIDRRLLPGEKGEEAVSEVQAFLKEQPEIDFAFKMDKPFLDDPAMEISASETVVAALADAIESVRGPSKICGVAYGTDASKMVANGIPTVIFGPGNILQAHSAAEFVDISQVEQAARIHEELARQLAVV